MMKLPALILSNTIQKIQNRPAVVFIFGDHFISIAKPENLRTHAKLSLNDFLSATPRRKRV